VKSEAFLALALDRLIRVSRRGLALHLLGTTHTTSQFMIVHCIASANHRNYEHLGLSMV
jgi:hypothetical protein